MTCKTVDGFKVFHCDECPEHVETECEDFMVALVYMKRQGWKTYKGPDKEFAHACPACVETYRSDQQAK